MLRSPLGRILLPLLILVAVILITFRGVLGNEFVNWDDQSEIIENPDFNPVSFEKLQWNWTHTRLTLYMPITYLAWGAVAAISPRDAKGILRPVAFHALNLGLHCICASLVFLLIRRLWSRTGPALLGALVFAVHPLQVEPVAWASGMYTLLSTALCLGALLVYLRRRTGEGGNQMRTSNVQRPRSNVEVGRGLWHCRALFALATALYIAALLTKASSISLPLAAGVIDIWILRRTVRNTARSLWLWIVLGIPIVWLARHFQDVSAIAVPPLWGRPMVALDAMGFYVRKVVLPIALIPDYGRNPAWVMRHPAPALLSAAIAVGVLLIAWFARRSPAWSGAPAFPGTSSPSRDTGFQPVPGTPDLQTASTAGVSASGTVQRTVSRQGPVGEIVRAGVPGRTDTPAWITAGIGLFVAGIFPYLGLTPFDFQYVSTVADRYACFGMAGVAMLAAGACIRSRIAAVVFACAVVTWSILSQMQVRHWHDTNALFSDTLAVNPRSLISHNVFGFLAARRGARTEAEAQYKAALQIWPEDAGIRFNLGNLFIASEPERARQQYDLAVRFQPNNASYHNSLGAALAKLHRPAEAFDQWQRAIELSPNYVDPRNNLADLYAEGGLMDRARAEYESVLQIDPNNVHARRCLEQFPR